MTKQYKTLYSLILLAIAMIVITLIVRHDYTIIYRTYSFSEETHKIEPNQISTVTIAALSKEKATRVFYDEYTQNMDVDSIAILNIDTNDLKY